MSGREAFQEVDYRAAFGPLAKWATEIDDPGRIPEIVARAFAIAATGRPGPVVVALPEDVLAAPDRRSPRAAGPDPAGGRGTRGRRRDRPPPRRRPRAARPRRRRRLGRAPAAPACAPSPRRTGCRCSSGFRCQDLLDNASPSYAGDAGLGKSPAVRALIGEADLILAIGVRFGEILTDGYTLFDVPKMAATLIHAHASDAELNQIQTADLPVARPPRPADAGARRRCGLDGAGRWAARTEAAHAAWRAGLATPPQPGALDMGEVVRHLQAVLPDDAILTNGAGNFAIWTNKHFPFTGRRRLLGPQSGAMGYGVPGGDRREDRPPRAHRRRRSPATATSR